MVVFLSLYPHLVVCFDVLLICDRTGWELMDIQRTRTVSETGTGRQFDAHISLGWWRQNTECKYCLFLIKHKGPYYSKVFNISSTTGFVLWFVFLSIFVGTFPFKTVWKSTCRKSVLAWNAVKSPDCPRVCKWNSHTVLRLQKKSNPEDKQKA